MNFDDTRHGRISQTKGAPAILKDWQSAAKMAESHPGPGEWVPREAVWVHDGPSARLDKEPDSATVERYADAYFDLPPITVQRDTFALIDGRHRLAAAYLSGRGIDFIRIQEVDVSDDDMIDLAVKANVSHGRVMSQAERIFWAKDFLKRHTDWTDARIAEWTGASRMFVWQERSKVERRSPRESDAGNQGVNGLHPDGPVKRLGRDDKWQTVPERKAPKTFSPAPDPGYDDDTTTYPDDDLPTGVDDGFTLEDQGDSLASARAQLEGDTEEAHEVTSNVPFMDGVHGALADEAAGVQPKTLAQIPSPKGATVPEDLDWYDSWMAIGRIAMNGREKRDVRRFLKSVPAGWQRNAETDLADALEWLRDAVTETAFA